MKTVPGAIKEVLKVVFRPMAGLAVLSVCFPGFSRADWGDIQNSGAPIQEGREAAVAFLSVGNAVMVLGKQDAAGNERIIGFGYSGGIWTPLFDGAPVDEGLVSRHRSPVLAADGTGGAVLLYGRHTGSAWRLFARRFDGAAFSDMNGGQPVDAGLPGNVPAASAALVAPGHLVAAFIQHTGIRTALYASEYGPAGWTLMNGGTPLDDPVGGYSESPRVTSAGGGVGYVVYLQVGKVFGLEYGPGGWSRLDGGARLDRSDLGLSEKPVAVVAANGVLVLAYSQEMERADGELVPRLFARMRRMDGTWVAVNNGAPMDAAAIGIADIDLAVVGDKVVLTYSTMDYIDNVQPSRIYSISIDPVTGWKLDLNNGSALETGTYREVDVATPSISTGDALLCFGDDALSAGPIYARGWSAAAKVGKDANRDEGVRFGKGRGCVRLHSNVARVGAGERISFTVPEKIGRARVSLHTVRGDLVRVLAEGSDAAAGRLEWDCRNAESRLVAPGVYLLVVDSAEGRSVEKVAVTR